MSKVGFDPVVPVVEALIAAGFVAAGHTDSEEVRISTSNSPVFGGIGGEVRKFGGRQRYSKPGTDMRVTVGPRTVNVYRVVKGTVSGFVGFDTRGIDLGKLREALGTEGHSGGESAGGGT